MANCIRRPRDEWKDHVQVGTQRIVVRLEEESKVLYTVKIRSRGREYENMQIQQGTVDDE